MIRKLLLFLFFVGAGQLTSAQELPQAQRSVFINFDSGFSIAKNSFTKTWDPYPTAHLTVGLPFYAGQLETGLRYTRFEGEAPTETDSDFSSYFIHVGYFYPIQINTFYQIQPGIRFGSNLMIFDEPEVYEKGTFRFVTDTSELEFAYELALRNEFKLSNHWNANATLSYNRTLTKYPLPITLISVGVSYTFAEPNWLKNFLR